MLQQSLDLLVDHHEILRTRFVLQQGELLQLITPSRPGFITIIEEDLSHYSQQQWDERLLQEERFAFRLDQGPLLRLSLLHRNDRHLLIGVLHHTISDGWSLHLLFGELSRHYNALLNGQPSPVPAPTLQYRDYTAWMEQKLASPDMRRSADYWHAQLRQLPLLQLPTDFPRPAAKSYLGASTPITLTPPTLSTLTAYCKRKQLSTAVCLLSTLHAVLACFADQLDIVTGIPVTGRNHYQLHTLPGCFVNTLLIRTKFTSADTLADAVRVTSATFRDALAHQEYTLEDILQQPDHQLGDGQAPLLSVLFNYQSAQSEGIELFTSGFFKETAPRENKLTSRFDLEFAFIETSGNDLTAQLIYDTDIFAPGTASLIAGYFVRVLDRLVQDEQGRLLDSLSQTATHPLSGNANNLLTPAAATAGTLIQLIDAIAARYPFNIAVSDGRVSYTYRHLQQLSTALASRLLSLTAAQKQPMIGVHLERDPLWAIAFLAILRSGAGYVPIDPLLPEEQRRYTARKAGVSLILCTSQHTPGWQGIPEYNIEAWNATIPVAEDHAKKSAGNLLFYPSVSDPAARLVIASPRSLRAESIHKMRVLDLDPTSVFAQTSPIHHPGSAWQLCSAWLSGACVRIYADVNDPKSLLEQWAADKVTVLPLSRPRTLQLLDHVEKNNGAKALSPGIRCLFDGTQINDSLLDGMRNAFPNARFHCFFGEPGHFGDILHSTPTGAPSCCEALPGCTVTIRDSQGNPCVPGQIGNIWFSRGQKNHVVKTGLMARWTGNLLLEFYGARMSAPRWLLDALFHRPLIKEILVPTISRKQRNPVVYLVPREGVSLAGIKAYWRTRLPAWMTPREVYCVTHIDYSSTGQPLLPEIGKQRAIPVVAAHPHEADPIYESLKQQWTALLDRQKIDENAGFFELGGNSLKAMRLLLGIETTWRLRLKMSQLFAHATLPALAKLIRSELAGKTVENPNFINAETPKIEVHRTPIVANPPTSHTSHPEASPASIYPASPAQWRMWAAQQHKQPDGAYNIVGGLDLKGNFDAASWQSAWRRLPEIHPMLLATFFVTDEQLYFQLSPSATMPDIPFADHSHETDPAATVGTFEKNLQETVFDLHQGPLFKGQLIKIAPHHHVFFFAIHHIIADEWSIQLLSKDILRLYSDPNAVASPTGIPRQPSWDEPSSAAYWQEKLANLPALTIPIADRPAKTDRSSSGNSITRRLPGALPILTSASGQTPSTTISGLLALVSSLLYHYTGCTDHTLLSPLSLRDRPGLENQVGLYLNTLPLRLSFTDSDTFTDLLKKATTTLLEAFDHKAYPFESIVAGIQRQQQSTAPITFPIMVVWHEPIHPESPSGQLAAEPMTIPDRYSKFDLTFHFLPDGDDLLLRLIYATGLYDEPTISRLIGHLTKLIKEIAAGTERPIKDWDYLSTEETQNVLHRFQGPGRPLAPITIDDWLATACRQFGGRTALQDDQRSLSYSQLLTQSDQLALLLKEKYGITTGAIVAVHLRRSVFLILSYAAIARLGAVFLPIDANLPDSRMTYLLEDSKADLLITDVLVETSRRKLLLDDDGISLLNSYPLKTIEKNHQPQSPLYIIYTSGSTGNPKGVLISHQNLANHARASIDSLEVRPFDNALLFTSISFDSCQTIIWSTLLTGGCLYIAPHNSLFDPLSVLHWLSEESITLIKLTPSHFKLLLSAKQTSGLTTQLKKVVVGGEKIVPADLAQWLETEPDTIFFNSYGPTEATVAMLLQPVSLKGAKAGEIAINHFATRPVLGKPIGASKAYILDMRDRLCGIGITGELCIGGPGVGLGYLHRPALTSERFRPAPFDPKEIIYRTGDLARWLPDGTIEFIGRRDFQHKINGYRVEMGEIESALLDSGDVVAAVARVIEDESRSVLFAFVTLRPGASAKPEELLQQLKSKLPHYAVPSRLIVLAEMPLSSSGKIDMGRLTAPLPEAERSDYVAPVTPVEKAVAEIFAGSFGVSRIGLTDNFFQLGGDSIKAIQLSSRLIKAGYPCEVTDIFTHPLIRDLCHALEGINVKPASFPLADATHSVLLQSTGGTPTGLPLFPAQFQFLTGNVKNKRHFNQSLLLQATQRIDPFLLGESLRLIASRHDAFKAIFSFVDGTWKQSLVNTSDNLFPLQQLVLQDQLAGCDTMIEHCETLQASFDISAAPLAKACLFSTAEGDFLFLVMHHLVTDGLSWRVLLEDLQDTYRRLTNGVPTPPPQPTITLAQWSDHLAELTTRLEASEEAVYWSSILSKSAVRAFVPSATGQNLVADTENIRFVLDSVRTRQASTGLHKKYGCDLQHLLLAALGATLHQLSGNNDHLIVLEGHGRESAGKGLSAAGTIGWFSTCFPFLLSLDRETDPVAILHRTAAQLAAVPMKGIGYGLLRSSGHFPQLPDLLQKENLVFNYFGDFNNTFFSSTEEPLFQFSRLEKGMDSASENSRGCGIRINAVIVEGKLEVIVQYSRDCYTAGQMTALAKNYRQQLHDFITALTEDPVVIGNNQRQVYPLSPLQEGIYYHWSIDPAGQTYKVDKVLHFSGSLQPAVLEQAYQLLLQRHPVLSTSFHTSEDGTLIQKIQEQPTPRFAHHDISLSPNKEEILSAILQTEQDSSFDLNVPSLIRLTAITTGEQTFTLIWTYHHIILDGWSIANLVRDLYQLYGSLLTGSLPKLAPARPFNEYIAWLQTVDSHAGLLFWKQYLQGYEGPAGLPFLQRSDHTRPRRQSEQQLILDTPTCQTIQNLCQRTGITINTFFVGVWSYLLARYNCTKDVVFGTVVSGRPSQLEGAEEIIGLLMNTIPLRVRYESDTTVAAYLLAIQRNAISTLPHHFNRLTEVLRTAGKPDLALDHLFVFENFPMAQPMTATGGPTTITSPLQLLAAQETDRSDYAFALVIIPDDKNKQLLCSFRYDANAATHDDVRNMTGHFFNIVNAFVAGETGRLGEIDYLSSLERSALMKMSASPHSSRPSVPTVIEAFHHIANSLPEAVAVLQGDQQLTYRQLHMQCCQLAAHLSAKGACPGVTVVVCHPRSSQLVVAILATMLSGAAFVPIDPLQPAARLTTIVEDCKPAIILTNGPNAHLFTGRSEQLVLLPEEGIDSPRDDEPILSTHFPGPTEIAYVLYTSGSSGKPKGVVIDHSSLMNYCAGAKDLYITARPTKAASYFHMPVSFDASLTALFLPLVTGKPLVLSPADAVDPFGTTEFLACAPYDFLKITPSHLPLLQAALQQSNTLPFHTLVLGGEKVASAQLHFLFSTAFKEEITIINEYGPTEATVGCAVYAVSNKQPFHELPAFLPIGRPMAGNSVFILDAEFQPCPPGIPGELFISGKGLLRTYLGDQPAYHQKMVHPSSLTGIPLYRSGDWAKWMPDGQLNFLGRRDEQVKINGHRIELAEVEAALLRLPGIANAAVLTVSEPAPAATDEQLIPPYLLAVYQTRSNLNPATIREDLYALLPDYMIPRHFISLEALPLNANGKLDRKALAAAISAAVQPPGESAKKEAVTPIEKALVGTVNDLFPSRTVALSDNFFELGGDSIKAIVLAGLLRKKGYDLPVRHILRYPDLNEMTTGINPVGKDRQEQLPAQPTSTPAGPLLLEPSASQKRLWLVDQLDNQPTIYNSPFARRIKGHVDPVALQAAWHDLIDRHECLRASFPTSNGLPKLRIGQYDPALYAITSIDLSASEDPAKLCKTEMRRQMDTPFDLSIPPLVKAFLFQLAPDTYTLFINIHHIIVDGWSKKIMDEDLYAFYTARLKGEQPNLPPLESSYTRYIDWQATSGDNPDMAAHRQYWLQKFSGEIPVVNIPTDFPRPTTRRYHSRRVTVTATTETTALVQAFGREHRTTPFSILLAATQVLLKRYSGQDQLLFGIPVAGRPTAELHRIVGLFLDTLPGQITLDNKEDFFTVVGHVRDELLAIFQHQAFTFDQLVSELNLQRQPGRSALFDILVVSEDFKLADDGRETAGSLFSVESELPDDDRSANKYDLTFYFSTVNNTITCTIGYDCDLFSAERIQHMAAHAMTLLHALVSQPEKPVGSHPYLSSDEISRLVYEFNDTTRPYGRDKTLHGLFAESVQRFPDHPAIRQDGASITYQQLQHWSCRLAGQLVGNGVRAGDKIAVITHRRPPMIAAMLAILQSGAAYVPVDPRYPDERKEYILTNAGVTAIVTDDPDTIDSLPHSLTALPVILAENAPAPVDNHPVIPGSVHAPHSLAYIIYTSGSSGRPKGVMIQHHSAVNLVEWVNSQFAVTENERLLFVTSMCFDLSVYDIFGTLAAGGTIVIATEEDVQNIGRLKTLLTDEAITFWDSVPTTLNYLVTELEYENAGYLQQSLRVAFNSGDWVPVQLPQRMKPFFPAAQFVSLGGATEATVWSNFYPVTSIDPHWKSIPYGRPITNNYFYILDEYLNPVPAGVTGELYIGGCGVADGYRDDPEKTAAAFLPDPFRTEPGSRMYRTGDLGRMTSGGQMEFLGRKDFQVKIRGFRVELGEIEVTLSQLEGVEQALVAAGKDNAGLPYLVAYYVGPQPLSIPAMTAHLAQYLPEYMLPAYFVHLTAWPLNENGKIDRKALPAPRELHTAGHIAAKPPCTETQVSLAGIWTSILNRPVQGIDQNFFAIGGHSLSAAQLSARIEQQWNVSFSIRQVFLHPTIESLAAQLDAVCAAAPLMSPIQSTQPSTILI
ncbi:MAG TPA: amino acid adenylation domain-containing protein [Puia sp.]|uniref:non-ribosomal peptide synthetase n=1 Tax=Puia sp. TaxID=2045100 RepID=UPI002CFB937D|nr:non-ribosomal peptide synthetase [Puia sp.]HVU95241.1 amino acid adenylation domain-containing protein [Puia sp.]